MKRIIGISIVSCLVILSGCSGHYTSEPGPYIPPVVDGIRWAQNPNSDYDCALGIGADGATFVVGAWNVYAGAAVAWLAYGINQDGPPGSSLVNCWNYAQWNWHAFDLYTHCYGQPVLKSSWTDTGKATAYVETPFCFCNVACAGFSNVIAPFWRRYMAWCSFNLLDSRCYMGSNAAAAPAMAEGTQTETEEPLPPEFARPGWDVNVPIPPHES